MGVAGFALGLHSIWAFLAAQRARSDCKEVASLVVQSELEQQRLLVEETLNLGEAQRLRLQQSRIARARSFDLGLDVLQLGGELVDLLRHRRDLLIAVFGGEEAS